MLRIQAKKEMPNISPKRYEEAEINVEVYEEILKYIPSQLADKLMDIEKVKSDYRVVNGNVSVKQKHNGQYCVYCDKYYTKLQEHQQTRLCKRVFENKSYAVVVGEPINSGVAKVVEAYHRLKKLHESGIFKLADYMKKKELERYKNGNYKKEFNDWIDMVMKKEKKSKHETFCNYLIKRVMEAKQYKNMVELKKHYGEDRMNTIERIKDDVANRGYAGEVPRQIKIKRKKSKKP